MRYISAILLTIILLQSCGGKKPPSGFDSVAWIGDRSGCLGTRLKMIDEIKKIQNDLRGLHRDRLTGLLGSPDETELYTRGQLIYRYRISPGETCPKAEETNNSTILEVRLNALGVVSEAQVMIFLHSRPQDMGDKESPGHAGK